jgi:hypothetical protein
VVLVVGLVVVGLPVPVVPPPVVGVVGVPLLWPKADEMTRADPATTVIVLTQTFEAIPPP